MKELSLHILDIVQNSIAAGCGRVEVTLTEDTAGDALTVVIADNGKGMPPDVLERVTDPFVTTRTTRKVGLGLPLFALTARQCGGHLEVSSEPGKGTRVSATMALSHIDRPPLGDMPSTLACLLVANPTLDLDYRHRCDDREFALSSGDVRRALDGISLSHPMVFRSLRELVEVGLAGIRGDGRELPAAGSSGPS